MTDESTRRGGSGPGAERLRRGSWDSRHVLLYALIG
jgi:hypothetical protein